MTTPTTVWNVVRSRNANGTWGFTVRVYQRRQRKRDGLFVWRPVPGVQTPRLMTETEAEEWGRKHYTNTGFRARLPRDVHARNGKPAIDLSDYCDEVTQAAARLGGIRLAVLARSNRSSWSVALCKRGIERGERWCVVRHLGTARNPHHVALSLGVGVEYAHRLPRVPGAEVYMSNEQQRDERAKAAAKEAREEAKRQRAIERAQRNAERQAAKAKREREKRQRAARKAVRTRKRNEAIRAKRSEAGKRAWQTRLHRQQEGNDAPRG